MTGILTLLLPLLVLAWTPWASAGHGIPGQRPLLASSVSPVRAAARDLGPAPAADVHTVVVSLAPRNPRALSRLLADLRDPAAPRYRHFLTREEFVTRHAPPARQERALIAHLTRHGLRVTYRGPNRLVVGAQGTIAAIEGAFGLRLHDVAVGNRVRRLALAEPSLPADVASTVVGVLGLGDEEMRPRIAGSRTVEPREVDRGPTCCAFGPPELARVYGTTGYDGAGQTIVVAGVYAWRPSDLASFNRLFGLPRLPAGSVQVCTGASKRALGCTYSDWGSDEVSLDIQYAHATAPHARILNYMAASPSVADFVVMLNTIVAGGGRRASRSARGSAGWVVSTSWGTCESNLSRAELFTYDSILANGIAIGQTWVAASGDEGSRDCFDVPSVDFPASSPHVIGVGGTTVTCAGDPAHCRGYGYEAAWSGSGGGPSHVFPRPAFQAGCGVPAGSRRLVPDVAIVADPRPGIFFRHAGAWRVTGGTSAGAPQWAGFFAQLGQRDGGRALGHPGPRLYALCGTSAYHDITEGENGDYRASAGYDLVTGLGSIDAATFFALY